MKKIKEKNAITLVALVITIIVLLILVGITISQLANNGLFDKSKQAKEQYQNAQEDEETKLAKYDNEIDSYVNGNRDYETEINVLKGEIQKLKNLYEYSTTEKIVGTWVDGKPVYQKTFTGTGTSTSSTYYTVGQTTTLLPNIEKVVNSTAYASYAGYLDYNTRLSIDIASASNLLRIGQTIGDASNTFDYIITIQYTKTID